MKKDRSAGRARNRRRPDRAIVVYSQVTWFANSNGSVDHFPTRPDWSWADLFAACAPRFDVSGGVVVVRAPDTDKARRDLTRDFLDGVRERGWRVSDEGARTGWFQVLRQGFPPVSFGVLDWMDPSRVQALFDVTDSAKTIAQRLGTYHNLTGGRWCGTGGLSGCAQIRALPRKESPLWHWNAEDVPNAAVEARAHLPLPEEALRRGWFVHHFDIRAQYLAAALNAELGWSAPEQRGPQAFDPARPGYWRVRVDQLPADPWGSVLYKLPDAQGLTWVTTPALRYFVEDHRAMVEVVDSITSARASRILRAWAEQMRKARDDASNPEVVPAVKDTYARTVGMMRRPGGRIHRQDWRDTIVDTGRINLIRKVDAMGVPPEHVVRWRTDSVWVVSPHAMPEGLTLDAGRIGHLRHEETLTAEQYHERFPDLERTPR